MTMQLEINNIVVEGADIVKWPSNKEALEFDNRLLPETIDIELDNTDIENYDDRVVGSLFYGADFFNWPVTLTDSEYGKAIFTGLLKDIQINDGSGSITLAVANYIEDLSKKNCVYVNASNKTPAEIIYELLTDSQNGNIDESFIMYEGFQNAINIQAANSAYVNVSFAITDNKNILSVINELLRMTQCHLFTYQNIIHMYQWQEYGGGLGVRLNRNDILSGSYRHSYTEEKIKNQYSIAYDNSGTVAYATGSSAASVLKYGARPYTVPDEKVDSTTSTEFKILFRNGTGAAWAGALAISRQAYIKKIFELELPYSRNYLKLTDQIDLSYYPFYAEPGMITSREVNPDKGTIAIKGEFLNTPHAYYIQDVEPPDPVEIVAAIPISTTGIFLKWSKCLATDFVGYKIYFTASNGSWYQEISSLGQSPVDRKTTDTTLDGYVFAYVNQLTPGAEYYFKVTAYDTRGNESLDSNVISCRTYEAGTGENMYCCQGNILEDFIWLDMYNSMGGTPPATMNKYDGTLHYDDDVYGVSAVYESGEMYNDAGWTDISWRAAGDPGDIQFQIQTSVDGTTWSAWTTPADAIATSSYALTGAYFFKVRFIFYSGRWSDTDYIYIKDIN